MRKIPVLTIKIISLIVGASILLSTTLFFIGFYQFDRQFEKQYRTTLISIAKTVRDSLNADLFDYYLMTKTPDGSWYAVHDILQRLVNDFDLNLIYVSYVEAPDYTKIHYIYNPVRKGNKFKEFPLGHSEEYIQHGHYQCGRTDYAEIHFEFVSHRASLSTRCSDGGVGNE